jgi:RimJ/RimL family protein N-acetyltransferase
MTLEDLIAKDPVLVDIPMPIRTPRLLLRPVRAGDGQAIHDMKVETWEQLREWMPWAATPEPPTDVLETEILARQAEARFIRREDLWLTGIESETGRMIAMTGLHRFDWKVRSFEIGYWVRASAQGKGYATEIANALTRYAFAALKARRVAIGHAGGNDRSRNVILKLGYELEATRRLGTALPSGDITDSLEYVRFDTIGLTELDVTWKE